MRPLKRVGERGGGQWEPVSWDSALDDIAARLTKVIERYGPEALAVAGSNANIGLDNGLTRRFMNRLGLPNSISGVAYCMGNTAAVSRMVYGWYPRGDLLNTRCIVLFGHDPLLTDDDHPATTEQLDLLSEPAASFSLQGSDGRDWLHNYFEATGGRGSVAMGGLSEFRKADAAAVGDFPASFGAVPESYASMIDGRCLPISAVPFAGGLPRGAAIGRNAGTPGQAYFVREK